MEALMATMIILDRPDSRHIPYFAMAHPSTYNDFVVHLDIDTDLHEKRIVGRRCADWVRARRDEDAIRLVATRNHVKPRTALYVNWLLFREEALANEFLDAFPQYQFMKRMERLRHERQSLAERVDRRLKRGGFDLSRFPEEQRPTIARRYVEAHDNIADLHRYEKSLDLAKGLADDWQDKL
jgi:hypothetical protein